MFVIMESKILAPSLLSADFSNLTEAFEKIENYGGKAVHIDVMDGQFVPEITYGQPVVRSVRKLSKLPFDVHLMVENPELQIESFAKAGADWITFHLEAAVHSHRIIQHIHELGKKAGISIVPSTPVAALKELLEYVVKSLVNNPENVRIEEAENDDEVVFSVYVEKFRGMSTYGSLSTVIIMMFWLYCCLYILLIGANLNRYFGPLIQLVMKKNK